MKLVHTKHKFSFQQKMSVENEDQTQSDHATVESADNVSGKSEILEVHEGIKSGESKFKVFTFTPTTNETADTEKCTNFWNFIEGKGDLMPAKAINLMPMKTPICPNDEGGVEEDTDWNDIMNLLKEHGLHKVTNDTCKICDYDKSLECICEDHFDIAELNSWDPFRKTFTDASVITDFIPTSDASTQTDFKSSQNIENEKRMNIMNEIDELMKKLQAETHPCECPQEKREEDQRVPSEVSIRSTNKTTCTCGNINCHCTEYLKVLTAIAEANAEVDALDMDEISVCGCRCLNLALIRNYKLLLESKIELESIWGRRHNKEVICVCKLGKCPCSIVLRLHREIDRIFGWEDEEEERVYCTCKEYYEGIWGRLSIATTPSYISCRCVGCEREFVTEEYLDSGLCDNCIYSVLEDEKRQGSVSKRSEDSVQKSAKGESKRCNCSDKRDVEARKMFEADLDRYMNAIGTTDTSKQYIECTCQHTTTRAEDTLNETSMKDVGQTRASAQSRNIMNFNEDAVRKTNLSRGGQDFCKLNPDGLNYGYLASRKHRYDNFNITPIKSKGPHLPFVLYEDSSSDRDKNISLESDVIFCKGSTTSSMDLNNGTCNESDASSKSPADFKCYCGKRARKTGSNSNSVKCKCIHTIISHDYKEGNSELLVEGTRKCLHDKILVPCFSVKSRREKNACCVCGDSDLNEDSNNGGLPPDNTPRSTTDVSRKTSASTELSNGKRDGACKCQTQSGLMKGDQDTRSSVADNFDYCNREDFGDFAKNDVYKACCDDCEKQRLESEKKTLEESNSGTIDKGCCAMKSRNLCRKGEEYLNNRNSQSEIDGGNCCAQNADATGEDYCSKRGNDSERMQCRRSTEIYYCQRISTGNSEATESADERNGSKSTLDYACCYIAKTESIVDDSEKKEACRECESNGPFGKIAPPRVFCVTLDKGEKNDAAKNQFRVPFYNNAEKAAVRSSFNNSSASNLNDYKRKPRVKNSSNHLEERAISKEKRASCELSRANARKSVATNSVCKCEIMTNTDDVATKCPLNNEETSKRNGEVNPCKDGRERQYTQDTIANKKCACCNRSARCSAEELKDALIKAVSKSVPDYTVVEQTLVKSSEEYLPNEKYTFMRKGSNRSCASNDKLNYTVVEESVYRKTGKSTNDCSDGYQTLKVECRNKKCPQLKTAPCPKIESAKRVNCYSNRRPNAKFGELRRAKTCIVEIKRSNAKSTYGNYCGMPSGDDPKRIKRACNSEVNMRDRRKSGKQDGMKQSSKLSVVGTKCTRKNGNNGAAKNYIAQNVNSVGVKHIIRNIDEAVIKNCIGKNTSNSSMKASVKHSNNSTVSDATLKNCNGVKSDLGVKKKTSNDSSLKKTKNASETRTKCAKMRAIDEAAKIPFYDKEEVNTTHISLMRNNLPKGPFICNRKRSKRARNCNISSTECNLLDPSDTISLTPHITSLSKQNSFSDDAATFESVQKRLQVSNETDDKKYEILHVKSEPFRTDAKESQKEHDLYNKVEGIETIQEINLKFKSCKDDELNFHLKASKFRDGNCNNIQAKFGMIENVESYQNFESKFKQQEAECGCKDEEEVDLSPKDQRNSKENALNTSKDTNSESSNDTNAYSNNCKEPNVTNEKISYKGGSDDYCSCDENKSKCSVDSFNTKDVNHEIASNYSGCKRISTKRHSTTDYSEICSVQDGILTSKNSEVKPKSNCSFASPTRDSKVACSTKQCDNAGSYSKFDLLSLSKNAPKTNRDTISNHNFNLNTNVENSKANFLNLRSASPSKTSLQSSSSVRREKSVVMVSSEPNHKKRLLISKAKVTTSRSSSKTVLVNKRGSKTEEGEGSSQKLFEGVRKAKVCEIEGCQSRLPVIAEETGKDVKLDVCTLLEPGANSRKCKLNTVTLCFDHCADGKNKRQK